MEENLSKEEIREIINDSQKEIYTDMSLIHPSFNKTDIIKISPKGLIFFHGNQDTGFIHINERHSSLSQKPFWKNSKLQTQSKFHSSIFPLQYVEIADKIFKSENLNLENNTSIENIDLYIGTFKINGIQEKYRLMLYKDTKIIHNLYPITKDNNLKFNKKFSRGPLNFNYSLDDDLKSIFLPYYNENKEISYSIYITFDLSKNIKTIKISKYSAQTEVSNKIFTEKKIKESTADIDLRNYQYKELRDYEKQFQNL
jgi:hypothetical protein